MTAPVLVSRTLAQRGRVAAAIVGALESEAGLAELRRLLADLPGSPDDDTVARRLRRGLEVAEAHHGEVVSVVPAFERALLQGAVLFQAGLFFEVHEVLERVWRELAGARRTVTQGLIQIAVGMHHLAHDNPRGAVSLFASGRARLASQGPVFEGVEVEALLAGLGPWETAALAGRWSPTLALPPFVVRVGDGRRVGGTK